MRSKELQNDYKKVIAELKKLINKWDPYKLVKGGAPKDEFESETISIMSGLPKCFSSRDVAQLISSVFTKNFGDSFSVESCKKIGEKVYSWYQKII